MLLSTVIFACTEHIVMGLFAGLTGEIGNVTATTRSNMQLLQLSGTLLQTPCATPSKVSGLQIP